MTIRIHFNFKGEVKTYCLAHRLFNLSKSIKDSLHCTIDKSEWPVDPHMDEWVADLLENAEELKRCYQDRS